MKTYRGTRTEGGVTVEVEEDGKRKSLPLHLYVRNHSPTGFEWGYGGSGPAQLALAICVRCLGLEAGQITYQCFKSQFVASWPHEGWEITSDEIHEWYSKV